LIIGRSRTGGADHARAALTEPIPFSPAEHPIFSGTVTVDVRRYDLILPTGTQLVDRR
jgi:hypothetical protein